MDRTQAVGSEKRTSVIFIARSDPVTGRRILVFLKMIKITLESERQYFLRLFQVYPSPEITTGVFLAAFRTIDLSHNFPFLCGNYYSSECGKSSIFMLPAPPVKGKETF